MTQTKTRLPNDQQEVKFRKSGSSEWQEGIFLKDENMFFIGCDDLGDFYWAWEIKEWKELELQNNKK
jgi:hypothetical protein